MIIQELRSQLELEQALTAALGASGHLLRLVLGADPERMLDRGLLLGVAKDLAGVLGCDYIVEFVLGADFRRVIVIGVDELFQDFVLSSAFLCFFLDACLIDRCLATLIFRLLLVSLEHLFCLLITN